MIKLTTVTLLLVTLAQSKTLPSPPRASKAECSNLKNEERFDCFPEINASQQACEDRGCCWVPANNGLTKDIPWCFYPQNVGGYEYINRTDTPNGQLAYLRRTFNSAYPRDVQTLKLEVEHQTNERVRVKISDAENARWEPPYPKIETKNSKAADNPLYEVTVDTAQVGFKVTRKDGSEMFNSQNIGPFIFADQYLQISSTFSGEIYGIGEHRTTLALDPNSWPKFTLWNHDVAPRDNTNLYGAHPFYLVVEPDGRSYGVFLHNSNAMDVLLQPLPAVTFRAIGGILDLYFFVGPTPAEVVRQYTELIGRPFLPPYWSLGFQLCKYGYKTSAQTRAVWERNRAAGIPYDVQWNDIDYMITQNDFTIDPNNFGDLPQLVDDIHNAGMRYVPILDPGVSAAEPSGTYPPYDDGIDMDIFVKDRDGNVFIAKVWNPTSTAFPDFTNPKTQEYWTKQIRELYERIPFDGLWIDMNEPANFLNGAFDGCPDDELENPPYPTGVDGGALYTRTVCMTAQQYAGVHYNVHNLYGISESEVTQKALEEVTGKRAFVLTRSTFVGSGKYAAHWTGDISSNWDDMAKTIPGILQSNIYGISMAGADICGFNGDVNENLCNRWMQLGAFYPFSRNHNSMDRSDQDPGSPNFSDNLRASVKKALTVRYTLLPYLYTLLYKAHVDGDTVARPIFFEFPQDPNTLKIDNAFLWGNGLYIAPVIEDNAEQITRYLPAGRWYDWYDASVRDSTGADVTFNTPFDTIPVLIRGGAVLPTQDPEVTTTLTRENDFTYIVALDAQGNANGSLFWDDGESIDTVGNNQYTLVNILVSNNRLTTTVENSNAPESPNVKSVVILGTNGNVGSVSVNGQDATFEVDGNNRLVVSGIQLPLSESLTVEWS